MWKKKFFLPDTVGTGPREEGLIAQEKQLLPLTKRPLYPLELYLTQTKPTDHCVSVMDRINSNICEDKVFFS